MKSKFRLAVAALGKYRRLTTEWFFCCSSKVSTTKKGRVVRLGQAGERLHCDRFWLFVYSLNIPDFEQIKAYALNTLELVRWVTQTNARALKCWSGIKCASDLTPVAIMGTDHYSLVVRSSLSVEEMKKRTCMQR